MLVQETPNDIFRRFTPTGLRTDFAAMGRRLRLETNSPTVLSHVRNAFRRYRKDEKGESIEFLWRIVSDPSSGLQPPLSNRIGFSDGGLRLVNLNQRAFLAVDLDAREAIAFLSPELCEDEMGFYCPVLSDLFDLSSAGLGLTEIMAGCVAIEGRGLLVFGSPRSGKTTAGYYSSKVGLEFHADQVTCLELINNELRAWGQFWPAAFRPETLQFLPEIEGQTCPFRYRDFTLLCLDNSAFLPPQASSVSPRACVFLDRCVADSPRLTRIGKEELTPLLFSSLPFFEDERFEPQRREVVHCLADVPAYHLAYAEDPCSAAELFPTLLA
jgi:hypothetical protein